MSKEGMTPDFDAFPAELRALPNWVCWKYGKPRKDGKRPKMPINPHTGRAAKVNSAQTWGGFNDALKAAGRFDGIGFVFSELAQCTGLDFDNKAGPEIKNFDEIPRDWKDILLEMESYTELSPSKTGLHVIIKGTLLDGMKHKYKLQTGELEVYESGRFFTVTANPLLAFGGDVMFPALHERGVALPQILAPRNESNRIDTVAGGVLDVSELLRRARNDHKFLALWHGDKAAYQSASEADLSLCFRLVFYCQHDAAAVESFFKQSGLYREDKWAQHVGEGETYGERTVRKALEFQKEDYRPGAKPTPPAPEVSQAETPTANATPQAETEETASDTGKAAGFTMSPRGLLYESEPGAGASWICGPFRITARTRNIATGTGWGKLIEFIDPDGTPQAWAMPMRELAGTDYIKTLYDLGLEISTYPAHRALLSRYIREYAPAEKIDCVERTGWHGETFVLPDECISTAAARAILENPLAHNPYSTGGTLANWQDEIAARAEGNSRLVFAISCAFSAPLLSILGAEENGGFHFRGMSSEGKTIILKAACSVWGGPDDYLQRWRATAVGIEQTAVAYNDTLLCLDEIGQVDPHTAGEVAYMLANGQGKLRGAKAGGLRKTERWRMIFLSSGEISLAQHMSEAGRKAKAGQELRLADIPSNAGAGFGVFEDLHDKKSGAEFAEAMEKTAAKYHGTAGRAFLREVLKRGIEKAARFIVERRGEFDTYIPKEAQGQAIRVARRFGLVAAAGELATALGVTGWQKHEATNAAQKCMNAWLEARGGAGQREITQALEQVQAFFELHGAARFTPWDKNPETEVTQNRAGFRRESETNAGEWDYYVFPSVFKDEICKGLDWRMIQDVLVTRGWIEPTRGADGAIKSHTRAERLPGIGNKRVYRFRAGFDVLEPENSEFSGNDFSAVAVWHCDNSQDNSENQTVTVENLPQNCHKNSNSSVAVGAQWIESNQTQVPTTVSIDFVADVANARDVWHGNSLENQGKGNLPQCHTATRPKLSPEERNANILLSFLLMRDPQRQGAAVDLQEIESEIGLQGIHFSQARAVLEEHGEIQITMYPRKSPVKLALKQEAA